MLKDLTQVRLVDYYQLGSSKSFEQEDLEQFSFYFHEAGRLTPAASPLSSYISRAPSHSFIDVGNSA